MKQLIISKETNMRFEYLFSKNRTVAPLNFPPQKSLISSPSVTRCS